MLTVLALITYVVVLAWLSFGADLYSRVAFGKSLPSKTDLIYSIMAFVLVAFTCTVLTSDYLFFRLLNFAIILSFGYSVVSNAFRYATERKP